MATTMKYRRLDADGDYVFGSGTNDFLQDTNAVAQAIKTRLLLLYGEWWEDTEGGFPLWQKILGKSGSAKNRNIIDGLIKSRILDTENVSSIDSFSSTWNATTRAYEFTANVTDAWGNTTTVTNT
jgi:hypothetical protein